MRRKSYRIDAKRQPYPPVSPGRKCTFRFLVVYESGRRAVITQDIRRRQNVRTGCYPIPSGWSDEEVVRDFGCTATFRAKLRAPDRIPKYERA